MANVASVRVKRGARWLDENFPGWEKRINVKTLDLADGQKCICGQVFKRKAKKASTGTTGYDYAVDTLFSEANKWINGLVGMVTKSQGLSEDETDERAERVSRALGFEEGSVFGDWDERRPKKVSDADLTSVSFEELQKAWEKLLAKRSTPVDN